MNLTHAMEEVRFRLRSYRGRYAEIAQLTGVSLSFCRKFRGGEKNPRIASLVALVDALECFDAAERARRRSLRTKARTPAA